MSYTGAPRLAEGWHHLGDAWALQQDFAQTVANYDRVLELNPQLAEVYANRGIVYLRLGKLEKAEADFARYQELHRTLSPAAVELWRKVKRSSQSGQPD